MTATKPIFWPRSVRNTSRTRAACAVLCAASVALIFPAAAQSIYTEAYTFTTFAGIAASGSVDGAGTDAQFNVPVGLAVDSAGNVYVADFANNTIRKITPPGIVTTIAGFAGVAGSADGPASSARFSSPSGVAVDGAGDLFIADSQNSAIRKITPSGVVTTLAGRAGTFASTDGTGTNARFNFPEGLAVDTNGNIYIADSYNHTIRLLTPAGVVTTLAGTAGLSGTNDGTGGAARFNQPTSVAVDNASNIYVADSFNNTVRKVAPVGTNWVVTTLAGIPGLPGGSSDGTGTNALFNSPAGVAVDHAGNVYVADSLNGTIRAITPGGAVTTLAGQAGYFGSADGTGTNARFDIPLGLTVDQTGNIFVADTQSFTIRKITTAELVTTIAGAGLTSRGSVNGSGSTARFDGPWGIATGPGGELFVADSNDGSIREITSAGVVTTLAGKPGNSGFGDGVGTEARFYQPEGLAVDSAANVYVADAYNQTIRKVTSPGVVTTLAGLPHISGYADGTETNALFNTPADVAVDSAGNLYVADQGNNCIRKMTPAGADWLVTTLAGGGPARPGGADGTGTNALFKSPQGIAVDSAGNVYVADTDNHTIRKITSAGVVTTPAGLAGSEGSRDGTTTNAQFAFPQGVAVDSAGNIYVADLFNNTIRQVTPAGVVTTLGGVPPTFGGAIGSADGTGSAARFKSPSGVAVDSSGALYVTDTANNTIRKGVFNSFTPASPVPFTASNTTGQLMVTLVPTEAGGQWRFPWEQGWRDSGATAVNLAQGEYPVEFRDIPGYLTVPLPGPVAVTNGGTVFLTNQYYSTIIPSDSTGAGGSLTVNIGPSAPHGAGWRFLGDSGPFYPPAYSTNLLDGTYLLEFAPVAGFITPASLAVQVQPGLPTVLSITYLLAQPAPAGVSLPALVPAGSINDLANYPYGFNGQLQTDVGYGSGVAVGTNVVLTAAHLIFNDQTLSYVNQAYWFYRQETGVFAPDPLLARGWYALTGYASERTNDLQGGLEADQSSPQSRNFDVAALYFLSPVANGGSGGFLPSDAAPNNWLTSTAEKLLTGYPVDGSQFGANNIVKGEMYQIGPQPYPLSAATDPLSDQQVYTASWFLSYPGNSGGPFYVQLNGYYYPAAVYLGTLFNGIVPYASAVRAIDSNVVSLISQAVALGDSGTNYHGGGVTTIIPSLGSFLSNPGFLVVQLGPPSAVQAGAAWELAGQPANLYSTANPSAQEVTSTNPLVLQFKPIPGWNLPANRAVPIAPGLVVTNVAAYTVTNPVLSLDPANGLRLSGTINTSYQIQSNSSLTGPWIPFKTNTVTNAAFNLITNKPRPGFYRAVWLPNSP